jgi:hypothetical protein
MKGLIQNIAFERCFESALFIIKHSYRAYTGDGTLGRTMELGIFLMAGKKPKINYIVIICFFSSMKKVISSSNLRQNNSSVYSMSFYCP